MNALIVYGSNYNVAVYCSINYVSKSKKSEFTEEDQYGRDLQKLS